MLNNCLLFYSSIKPAVKETEIVKLSPNLSICTGAEHLSNANERQENHSLCGLETEPVKLIRSQEGKLTDIGMCF